MVKKYAPTIVKGIFVKVNVMNVARIKNLFTDLFIYFTDYFILHELPCLLKIVESFLWFGIQSFLDWLPLKVTDPSLLCYRKMS